MYRCINRLAPNYLCDGLDYYAAKHDYNTRNSYRACLYLAKTNTECFNLFNTDPRHWRGY